MYKTQKFYFVALITLYVLFHHPSVLAQETKALNGASEFQSSNPDGRLTIKVQIWGDISKPGTYFIPDNTRLSDLLGLTGGTKGDIDDVEVAISRIDAKDNVNKFEYTGVEVISDAKAARFRLARNDIVYIKSKKTSEEFMNSINMVSAVTGAVSSVALLYLFYNNNSN